MKVIKVINSLNFGGVERVFEIVAKYYSGSKQDLVFVALGFGGTSEKFIRSLGYEVVVLNEKTTIPNFGLLWRLVKIVRLHKPDVVHGCGAEGNFYGLLASWIARTPIRIGEEIGIPSHSTTAKIVYRYIYRTCHKIITHSDAVGHYLITNKEAGPDKILTVYNPVDIDKFTMPRQPRNPAEFVFLTVCRLDPIKNLLSLLRVFSRLVHQNGKARLWLVGDGIQRAELEKLTSDLGLNIYVRFFGYQENPAEFYGRADVFILPSFSEGHPVSVIEAMIAELPVIATKVGGASEIIKSGENGWLIDPMREDDIFARVAEVSELPAERLREVASKAKEQARRLFSPAGYLKKVSDLYNKFA